MAELQQGQDLKGEASADLWVTAFWVRSSETMLAGLVHMLGDERLTTDAKDQIASGAIGRLADRLEHYRPQLEAYRSTIASRTGCGVRGVEGRRHPPPPERVVTVGDDRPGASAGGRGGGCGVCEVSEVAK